MQKSAHARILIFLITFFILGGGATTIGLAVAALCGVAITGPIAALVGGIVVVSNASVNLQFALGTEYAVLVFLLRFLKYC